MPDRIANSEIEAAVAEAIAICGGDARAALQASLIANAYLEAEVDRLTAFLAAPFRRARRRRQAEGAGDRDAPRKTAVN